jgi:hypothetical protein
LALCLWRAVGWQRDRTINLNMRRLDMLMCRRTAQRALSALEGAGLVSVKRSSGRCPRVTVLDVPDKPTPRKRKKR